MLLFEKLLVFFPVSVYGDCFCLQIDASGVGIGAVHHDGCERPFAYYSWKLSPAELNYAIS